MFQDNGAVLCCIFVDVINVIIIVPISFSSTKMTTKIYSVPRTEVLKARVRMSILAGSGNTTNQVVAGHDFGFGARQRNVSISISKASID